LAVFPLKNETDFGSEVEDYRIFRRRK